MKVSLVTIAYNLPLSTRKLIDTAMQDGLDLTVELFLHSNHGPTVEMCYEYDNDPNVNVHPYGVNRGLSKSWNEGMELAWMLRAANVVIIANDDIYFSKGDVAKIAEKSVACPENYIISCAGWHTGKGQATRSHGYSCFAINRIAFETLGAFDENIFPIYMEDCDYAYRARLAGLTEENCPDTMVYHGGSSAINADLLLNKQNGRTHGQNMLYYKRKWGGENGAEVYKRPFNDPDCHPYYISPSLSHTPYGVKHDRTDQDIVRM